MYAAFKSGRSTTDPSVSWDKGEIGFFDFYIIPLAKKLKDCQVFGVSSDEYLNYALANRRKWEIEGRSIVAEMVERLTLEPSVTSQQGTSEEWPLTSRQNNTWSNRFYPASLKQPDLLEDDEESECGRSLEI